MKNRRIPTKFGSLEAQISLNKDNPIGILIFHPHPLYGGTMFNNVVDAVYHNFADDGFSSIRFNFRGVGSSNGTSTDGTGESKDCISALNYFLKEAPWLEKILLIGYSFGAAIGCSIVDKNPKIMGYIAISYPFTFIPLFLQEARSSKPKLFLMGKNDDFTSMQAFNQSVKDMPEPKDEEIFEGVNHFWNGVEGELVNSIRKWCEKWF